MKTKLIIDTVKKDIIDATDCKISAIALKGLFDVEADAVKKVGDTVAKGELIAQSKDDLLSVCYHSPIYGKVTNVDINTSKLNKRFSYISVEALEKKNKEAKIITMQPLKEVNKETLRIRLQQAGIVGCGGAGFPAYAKIKQDVNYSSIVINACVSDYLTCADLGILYHNAEDIIKGAQIIKEALDIKKVYIVLNKFCKKAFSELVQKIIDSNIEIFYMPNKYGQGDEKLICKYLFNYNKEKSFPAFDGILVYNAQTFYQIYKAIEFGEPVTSRVVTVCGKLVTEPRNYRVAIGSNIQEVITRYGNLKCSYIEYQEREQATMERFAHLRELKKDLQEKKDSKDVAFLKDFVEERKATNKMIFDFLKYEKINKPYVSFGLLVGGRKYGKLYDGNILNMQKTTYCIEHINQRTYEKYYKKFRKIQQAYFKNDNKSKIK